MQNYSTELAILRDKNLKIKEQELLTKYEVGLKCYANSQELWKAIIHHNVDNVLSTGSYDEDVLRSLKPMLSQYGIEVTEQRIMSRMHPILPPNALQTIWAVCSEKIESANKILLNQNP